MQPPRGRKIQGAGTVLSRPRVLVLGIGNPIRNDDGVGPVVAESLRGALPEQRLGDVEVRVLDAGGWNLIPEIEGFDGLILIDAYFAADAVPGRVRTLGRTVTESTNRPPDSAHLIGIGDALNLSRNLGYHTPDLLGAVTVDVGESCMHFGEGLTPPIRAAVPLAADAARSLLEGYLARTPNK